MMKVRLHCNEQAAARATDQTLKMLPMGGNASLVKNSAGEIVFDDAGLATVETSNPEFVKFALGNQGYVKEVFA